jgi:hypothetical protein
MGTQSRRNSFECENILLFSLSGKKMNPLYHFLKNKESEPIPAPQSVQLLGYGPLFWNIFENYITTAAMYNSLNCNLQSLHPA